jgi:hypothetical protein
MSLPQRLPRFLWLIVPLCGAGFLAWLDFVRGRHAEQVSRLPGIVETAAVVNAASPTGYTDQQRALIPPERNEGSFHWIMQTQRMLARGEWRVRHVDYDNAPTGREVNAASPYRWWLGLLAWCDHVLSGRPLGLAVEHTALYAGPALHLLWLAGATALVGWRFGAWAATLVSLGLVAMFPLAGDFWPGLLDHHGPARLCAFGGVLFLLAGIRSPTSPDSRPAKRWFALAGIMSGLGVWICVSLQLPVLIGTTAGALLASWPGRTTKASAAPLPWRTWAFSGGATTLAACLVEYFPAHLGEWHLESVHSLYGLAWVGTGELIARTTDWVQRPKPSGDWRDLVAIVLAAATIVALPVAMHLTGSLAFLAPDLTAARLSHQPESVVAASVATWVFHDGFTTTVWATILPVFGAVPCAWLLLRHAGDASLRATLAIAFGPVLVAFGLACTRLEWWSTFDAMALLLIPAAAAIPAASSRWLCAAPFAAAMVLGAGQLASSPNQGTGVSLTRSEAEMWAERDVAHWLALRAGSGAIVLAPPATTTSLCFYGSLRGLGTFSANNQAGVTATVRIITASSDDEARTLIEGRDVAFIVMPSWDPFFEAYVQSRFSRPEAAFITGLPHGKLPLWLRPVAYPAPKIAGFEDQSVRIFAVVEDQSEALAASRLAEYWLETGDLANAAEAEIVLRRFPADLGALVARAHVQAAHGDGATFAQTIETVAKRLSGGADRTLPWDRRVSLAILLARAKRLDLAREQLHRCFAELDAGKLRTLPTASLYNLLGLGRALDFAIADPPLHALALELLPPALRRRVQ